MNITLLTSHTIYGSVMYQQHCFIPLNLMVFLCISSCVERGFHFEKIYRNYFSAYLYVLGNVFYYSCFKGTILAAKRLFIAVCHHEDSKVCFSALYELLDLNKSLQLPIYTLLVRLAGNIRGYVQPNPCQL